MSLIRTPVLQMAYVVDDIEKACHHWATMFGAGPFQIIPHFKSLNGTYRGSPATEDVTHALGYCGNLNIQFTQQHNDVPSVWREVVPAGASGPHHIMIMPTDFDAELQRFLDHGCTIGARFDDPMPVSDNTGRATAKVVYLDARPQIGCFVELFEDCEVIRGVLAYLKQLHDTPSEHAQLLRYAV